MKKLFAIFASAVLMLSMLATSTFATNTNSTYECQLYAKITDKLGQVVSKMVIDYGEGNVVGDVDTDTFEVNAKALVAFGENKDKVSYQGNRQIERVETDGQYVEVYFNLNDGYGSTLTSLAEGRSYPAELSYTVTQTSPITLNDQSYQGDYTVKSDTSGISVIDEETVKFESVIVEDGLNYQYYDAGDADSLIIWFHGNGEGDVPGNRTDNNVTQMLSNRGTVAWATDSVQDIFDGAHVMAFHAPDTWYYAQSDGLLAQAYNEINEVIEAKNIDPDKVYVAGGSAGGYMTTRMVIAYPDLFKAAMITCPAINLASQNGGETPTDEEIASLKDSRTAIWLVQANVDVVVDPAESTERMFNILSEGQTVTTTQVDQELNSDYTTKETADGKYKWTLYDTVGINLQFAEDYDQDGIMTAEEVNGHGSWIFTLNNNPTDASGTSIMAWAANYLPVESEVVDKTLLQIAVDVASEVTDEDLDKVVPVVVAQFKSALEEAQILLADTNATQAQIDASFDRLSNVIQMLEFIKGDKTALQELVNEIQALDSQEYTSSSWANLTEQLNNAQTVLADENALQEEVDTALASLQTALEDLQKVADKTYLEAFYNRVVTTEESKYLSSSWTKFAANLETAKDVLDNETALQEEVDNAYSALVKGYLNLRLKPNKDLLDNLIK